MSQTDESKPSVVCLSRSLGAGGEVVGQIVAEGLGFRYVDEEIVKTAADKLGVPVDLVADVEARRSLTRRLLEEVLSDMGGASMLSGATPPPIERRASDDYRALIQQAITETAEQGQVVIVAHAASQLLAGRPGVLRIFITASPQTTAARLAADGSIDEKAAAKLVKDGDLARADYLKRFYGISRELPTHYDLVVNTDVIGPEAAAQLVLAACGR
jgi:cytidylate kinase